MSGAASRLSPREGLFVHQNAIVDREFKKDYLPARCYVFHGGATPLYFDDVVAIPMAQALANLAGILGATWAPAKQA